MIGAKAVWYLAGPMAGHAQHNYPMFAKCANELRAMNMAVVSPHKLHRAPAEGETLSEKEVNRRLRVDMQALSKCDGIILLPGWSKSVGAKLELQVALGLRLHVCYYDGERVTDIS